MKSYKLVNSLDGKIQEKAERLGYDFGDHAVEAEFIFLYYDGSTDWGSDLVFYCDNINPEITQADLLALPENLNIGDWFKYSESENEFTARKVYSLTDDRIYISDRLFVTRNFNYTKLTPEQIEILGLEKSDDWKPGDKVRNIKTFDTVIFKSYSGDKKYFFHQESSRPLKCQDYRRF